MFDDVVNIELQGGGRCDVYPLVDPSYTPDAAIPAVDDGLGPDSTGTPFLNRFPYLGTAYSGFNVPAA